MDKLECIQKAGSIHKRVRKDLKNIIKPGIKLIDIANFIEGKVSEYTSEFGKQVNNGIAFPTGISINNIAAHWTPPHNDETVLKKNDICKIDFGVHLNGWIIDSAFTINSRPEYDNLLLASKDAVDNMIKNIGCDMAISELGNIAEEIVNSYEIEEKGHLKKIKSIDNLTGHSIDQWNIHSGKYVFNVKNDNQQRIVGDEFFAIEVFTTTGSGTTKMKDYSNHYMLKKDYKKTNFKFKRTYECLDFIEKNFKTLAFCPRHIYNINNKKKYDMCLNELFNSKILNSYPPLYDIEGSHVAQFEHTVYISESKKMVLSKSDDY